MNCLEIQNLWKSYPVNQNKRSKRLSVLKNLNLQIAQGDTVAVMGPSGSGKTTLLNLIGGVDRPDQGRVLVEGRPLNELDADEMALFRRKRLGLVFQDFNLIESLTVRENILLPMILEKKDEEEQEAQVPKLMNLLGIGELADKSVADISGGEKQRAAICRALVNDPALLLADEPTGNLDSRSTKEVMNHFIHINRQLGTTLLMVTHEPFAASYCRRVVFLKDGEFAGNMENPDPQGGRKGFLDATAETLTRIEGEPGDIL